MTEAELRTRCRALALQVLDLSSKLGLVDADRARWKSRYEALSDEQQTPRP